MYADAAAIELVSRYVVEPYQPDPPDPPAQLLSAPSHDPRIMELTERCRSFLDLPENWNSYRSKRIDETLLKDGLRLLSMVLTPRARTPTVVPTARGGLQIEWHAPDHDLEIEVHGLGHYRVFHRRDDVEPEEFDVFDNVSAIIPLVRSFPA